MRSFACSSLGNDCSWKHVARTEELLADVVAVHLRDVHGTKDISPAMLGRIKGSFGEPTPVDVREAGNLELKEFTCKDLGLPCTWRYIAQTEDLIVDGVAVHAREAHGITEFTQEMKVKVEKALRPWKM